MHLQEVGREFGVTTGRRRRCGWLDLVVMKHSCLINGYDSLNLTKLDILDDLDEIKVAVKYLVNEKELPGFPGESSYSVPGILRRRANHILCSGPRSAGKGRRCICDATRMETGNRERQNDRRPAG